MQKRYMKKILKYGTIAIIIMVTIIIGINLYVKISTNKQIVTQNIICIEHYILQNN